MIGQPAIYHAGAELLAQVDREVREAHAMGDIARGAHRLRRAAAALAVVLRVSPPLERPRHRLDGRRRLALRDAALLATAATTRCDRVLAPTDVLTPRDAVP